MLAGAVIAVAALAMTVTTQNVRETLGPERAHHDIDQAAQHSSLVLTQEMGHRNARAFAPPGDWGTAHHSGARRGDCATFWQRDHWHLVRQWLKPVTWPPFPNGLRFALVTILRGHGTTVAAVCVHMMTHALRHPIAYRNGTRRLAALVRRLELRHRHVIIGGDWNLRFGEGPGLYPFDVFPRHQLASRRPPQPTGGNGHGGRIDYLWTRQHTTTQVSLRVLGHTYSDHQAVRVHLALQ